MRVLCFAGQHDALVLRLNSYPPKSLPPPCGDRLFGGGPGSNRAALGRQGVVVGLYFGFAVEEAVELALGDVQLTGPAEGGTAALAGQLLILQLFPLALELAQA